MKKLFLVAALASVALVSCVKNDPAPSVTQQDAITFAAPVVGLNTKAAAEVWNNYPTGNDFAVWAHYFEGGTYNGFANGMLYMDDVTVTYVEGTWAPGTEYYWPKNGSLTFSAYAPSTVAAGIGATGITFSNYSVDTDATKQVDLLFSERAYNKVAVDDDETGNADTGSTPDVTDDVYKGVHISFKHALSSILFTARLEEAYTGTTITLKKIELTGVNSTGSFDQGLTDANNAVTVADADLWKNEGTPKTYTVTGDKVLTVDKYYTCNATTTAPAAANGGRATDFILLPQAISNDAKIVVTYTMKSPTGVELTQVLDAPLKTTNVPEWEWGYRYIYNIIVGLDKIYFEPYVAPWIDADDGLDINI